MYQKVIIVGNLGRDPEMRYLEDGTPVTNFSLATNRKWKSSDGSPREETTWWRITTWRGLAETCNQYLQKGRLVLVEGRVTPNEDGSPRIWTGDDGIARASFEVTAESVKFLPSGKRDGGRQEPGFEEEDDSIPF